VLDPERAAARRPTPPRAPRPGGGGKRRPGDATPARVTMGPHGSAGPYEDGMGERYDVRLERVPGGLRLAEWAGGVIRRRAPVLRTTDLPELVEQARGREALAPHDADALAEALAAEGVSPGAQYGASAGRAGDMQEELRVEPLDDGMLRIARWVLRPGSGWELQDAPVMLPAKRYAEGLASAARAGLLADR
jgi:hypothetical protein